jgi:rare lipoprotein A
MAVNTQKLLPSSKGSPLANISAAKITKGMSIKVKKIDTQKLLGPAKEDSSESIKGSLVKIDSLLKSILGEEKKNQSKKRKEKEKKDFEEQEKKLEAPKESKKFKLPGLAVPGMSFLDRIKRFLFFTALGWLFTKFQDQLPKLQGIITTITQVYVVAEDIFKSLLGGLVNFIDIGYQTYDGLRKQVENIGGKDAVKTFDDFSSHLNELLNGTLMVATLVASTAPKAPNAPSGAGSGTGIPKPTTPKPISGFGSGTEMTPGRYRAPGQSAARGFALEQARKGLSFEQSVAARQAAPAAKAARFGGGRIPVVGPLITFLVRTVVYKERPEKAAAAAVGMGIGQAIGGFIGTLGAGALGLGTAGLGAFVAPLIIGAGSVIGGLVGEWLGAKLYDFVAGMSNKNKPQQKAAGGPVTRGGKSQGAVSRSLKITRRRPPKIRPKQSQPGKDVGGKKNIQKLYPDPSANVELEGEQKSPWYDLLPKDPNEKKKTLKGLPNSYKALTGVAKKLKDIPFGIGALMGGAVDIALGEKLPKDAIDSLGNGIAYLINAVANQQVSASISGIGKEISKMQSGGVVPRLRDFSKQDQVGTDITKVLNGLIRNKVDEAIREVQKQMMPNKYSDDPGSPDSRGGGGSTGPYGAPPRLGPGGPITTVPGIVDQKGRPVRFASTAAAAFILMMEDAKKEKKPFKGSDIASTYRDPQLNEDVGGAENSPHLYGLAADIHGTTGAWIRSKGRDYGWVPYDYEGTHGGHYEYKGGGKKEKPVKALPDIFKQKPKQRPGDLSPIFQLPGQEKSTQKVKQSGQASWYGPGFYGNRTANGELFREGDAEYTAAHRTLPFGTKVTVTNKSNGKSIQVRINDRGPFKEGRIIDLNKAARDALGGQDLMNVDLSYKGGGYIPKQTPNKKLSSLRSYPSYADGGMMIAIQPMIIEKPIPMPMGGNKTIIFPVPISVNNSNMPNLSRG